MSEALKGALIIGQSGGPSSVINASAYGCIRTALDAGCITRVYGAYHGIKGVLNDELLCMDEEDRAELDRLPYTCLLYTSYRNDYNARRYGNGEYSGLSGLARRSADQ